MTPDYSQLSTPELNKLIHDLSVESRNRYETQQALRNLTPEQQAQLDELHKQIRARWNPTANIDAKAPRNDSEAIPDAE